MVNFELFDCILRTILNLHVGRLHPRGNHEIKAKIAPPLSYSIKANIAPPLSYSTPPSCLTKSFTSVVLNQNQKVTKHGNFMWGEKFSRVTAIFCLFDHCQPP